MRCGGWRWSRPCLGRNATGRSSTGAIVTGSDGSPYGVSRLTCSACSSKSYSPEPPITASSTGDQTFAFTVERRNGSGDFHLEASSNRVAYLYVDHIRG